MLAPSPSPTSADLFRVLGDEDRLRLLALCAADELTVGELAELTEDSQPQVSRKCQPLRAAGLLRARKEGTRTLLSMGETELVDGEGPVVAAALREGRRLCALDGSLSRVPLIVAAREESSKRFFEAPAPPTPEGTAPTPGGALPLAFVGLLAPLLPGRSTTAILAKGAKKPAC